jgi:hypothetical protein
MTNRSMAKVIQDALYGILDTNKADLKVDARNVTIARSFPGQRHGQNKLPLVVIARPLFDEEANFGQDQRRVYTVPVGLFDGGGATADKVELAKERLEMLFDRMMTVLQRSATDKHWGLVEYQFFRSFVDMTRGDFESGNSNMMMLPVSLAIPVVVKRGTVPGLAPVVPTP